MSKFESAYLQKFLEPKNFLSLDIKTRTATSTYWPSMPPPATFWPRLILEGGLKIYTQGKVHTVDVSKRLGKKPTKFAEPVPNPRFAEPKTLPWIT